MSLHEGAWNTSLCESHLGSPEPANSQCHTVRGVSAVTERKYSLTRNRILCFDQCNVILQTSAPKLNKNYKCNVVRRVCT